MRMEGFEPPCLMHCHLKAACIPISPHPRIKRIQTHLYSLGIFRRSPPLFPHNNSRHWLFVLGGFFCYFIFYIGHYPFLSHFIPSYLIHSHLLPFYPFSSPQSFHNLCIRKHRPYCDQDGVSLNITERSKTMKRNSHCYFTANLITIL